MGRVAESWRVLNAGAGIFYHETHEAHKKRRMGKMEVLYREESYLVMGACFEVYKEMGCGFLEAVYQECLGIEFGLQSIPFQPQLELPLRYKHHELSQKYQPDFVCYDKIVLEIKSVTTITDRHRAQVHNYLCATGYRLGIIANFNHHPKLEWERIIR
jgi:GxxExxY protein